MRERERVGCLKHNELWQQIRSREKMWQAIVSATWTLPFAEQNRVYAKTVKLLARYCLWSFFYLLYAAYCVAQITAVAGFLTFWLALHMSKLLQKWTKTLTFPSVFNYFRPKTALDPLASGLKAQDFQVIIFLNGFFWEIVWHFPVFFFRFASRW